MSERFSTVENEYAAPPSNFAMMGDVLFDIENRSLTSPVGETVLEPRVSEVLTRLINTDGPVSRREFLEEIWGVTGSDEALTQAISRLRRAMVDTDRPYRIIKTVPRGGYILGCEVEWTDSSQAVSASQPTQTPDSLPSSVAINRNFLAGIVVGAAMTFIAMMIWVNTQPSAGITNISN